MPFYRYECEDCGKTTEAFQKMSDEPLKVCPSCGGHLKKLLSSVGIVFKGVDKIDPFAQSEKFTGMKKIGTGKALAVDK